MWVKVANNQCVNLGQALCVAVRAVETLGPVMTGGPVSAQNVMRFDVEAVFSDKCPCVLASFPTSSECGYYQAKAKAEAAFARIMRAAGDSGALLDLMQPDVPGPGSPALSSGEPGVSPFRFAM